MGQWCDLPGDILEAIEGNLVLYGDKVRVRAVCGSWNSHLQKMPNHQVTQLPWLLQALESNKEASHGLFTLGENKFYYLNIPEAHEKLFKGSSQGWVGTIEDIPTSCSMYLINPLTRARIQLPPRSTFPDVVDYCANKVGQEYALVSESLIPGNQVVHGIKEGVEFHFASQDDVIHLMDKIVLSSPPSTEDCVVVAIYGVFCRLAYCRCNDKKWTPIHLNLCYAGPNRGVLDVIFYKGKLHVLNYRGGLIVFDDIETYPNASYEIVVKKPPCGITTPTYLVESSDGGLLIVTRVVDFCGEEHAFRVIGTETFRVCKLDLSNSCWVEVKNIGEDMLFLGYNSSSKALSSRDFPGYKGNCIYFSDSYSSFRGKETKQEKFDIGVFNLESWRMEVLRHCQVLILNFIGHHQYGLPLPPSPL